MTSLLALLLFAVLSCGALFAFVWLDARRSERDRVTYRLTFPRGLRPAQVAAAWTALSGRPIGRHPLVLEVIGRPAGLEHRLTLPRASFEAVTAQLRAALPGLRFDLIEEGEAPAPFVRALDLRLSSRLIPLQVGDATGAAAKSRAD
jgi:hypothetical protein